MVLFRKILATIFLLGGMAAFGGSLYIFDQIAEGNKKVEKAEKTLKKTDQLFSLSPVTKDVGQGLTKSAQKKIGEGKEMIASYATLAEQLRVGGVIAAVLGLVLFFIPNKKKAR